MSKFYSAETQQGHSSHLVQYIRKLSEASSKQEEDQIVEEDLKDLKSTLTSSSSAKNEELLKEYAVRAYYAELMGHSAEFAYIHCINLACHRKLNYKRTGYLATALMVNPESELMYLIVSSIQRDLKSPNYLEVSAALTAAAQLLRPELMTVVQGEVAGLVTHEKPLVRRKVVETMHAFYARSDAAVGDVTTFRQALCDRDPSVMDAATRLLHEVVRRSPEAHRDLLDSFTLILSQVIERRLPRTYDFHRTPAPWLQIRVIQIITVLIGSDAQRAQKAAHVLGEAMQRADNGKLIGFAIICELIRTAATIPPLPSLLSLAAEAVDGLIKARNPNLRCAGIQALSYMVRVRPDLAAEHQEVVMSCLEDADETVRRKTIWLLFAICDRDNIGPIARRLIRFLAAVSDPFLKRSTARGLCRLMEQHATNPWWYIRTMNSVLAVAAECVLPTTTQRMLKLIAEGQGADETEDTNFRIRCVEAYFAITGGATASAAATAATSPLGIGAAPASATPEVLRRIGAWVMGEYGFLASKIGGEMLLDRLCDLIEQTDDGETRCWVLTAIMKVSTQVQRETHGGSADFADDAVAQFRDSGCIPLQQRCYEFAALRQQPELLRRVLPKDGFCEAVEPDPALHFLDSFIEMAVGRGAQPYKAPADVASLRQQRAAAASLQAETGLKTAAYVPARATDIHPAWGPASATSTANAAATSATGATLPNAGLAQSVLQGSERVMLQPTATKRWGAQNMREMEAAEEEVHLQVVAAAAVGGGGIVWGADTVNTVNEASPVASPAPAMGVSSAFSEPPAPASGGGSRISATASKPVSAKNAKFVRSIFGGGRRKSGGGGASRSANAAAVTATASPAALASAPLPPPPPPQAPRTSAVLDALFANDTASPHPPSSPLGVRADPAADWFSSSPHDVPASPPVVKSPSGSGLRPAPPAFATEQFGRAWQLMSAAGEQKQQLHFGDLSSYAASGSALQQHLLRTCSLRVVQIIGKELIAAAQVVSDSGKEEYVLAHLTVVDGNTVNAVIRSSRREMSATILRALEAS